MVVEVICLIEVLNADIVILNIQTGWHLLRWMLAPSIAYYVVKFKSLVKWKIGLETLNCVMNVDVLDV